MLYQARPQLDRRKSLLPSTILAWCRTLADRDHGPVHRGCGAIEGRIGEHDVAREVRGTGRVIHAVTGAHADGGDLCSTRPHAFTFVRLELLVLVGRHPVQRDATPESEGSSRRSSPFVIENYNPVQRRRRGDATQRYGLLRFPGLFPGLDPAFHHAPDFQGTSRGRKHEPGNAQGT